MRGSEFAELRAFAEVADRRSFARAAEHLRVAPSTLSQTVRSLEERLGVTLLNRTTRRVSLTSAGARLLARCAPAMDEMEAAVLEAHDGQRRPRGVVRLHVLRPAYARHVEPALGRIQQALPDVVLELSIDDVPAELAAGGFELLIRRADFVDSGMVALDLGADLRHTVVASPDYLKSHGTPSSPQDLQHHRCIQWRPSGSQAQRWQFQAGEDSMTIPVSGPLIVSHCDAAIAAALQGVGMAYVLESYSSPFIADGRLISLLTPYLSTFGGWKVCYPKHAHLSAAALAVAELLSDLTRRIDQSGTAQA